MTMRERLWAFAQGREHDRVPFAQYAGCGGPEEEIWAEVGRENMGVLQWIFFQQFVTPNCRLETEDIIYDSKKAFRRTLFTPKGQLDEVRMIEPALGSSAAATTPICCPIGCPRWTVRWKS